MKTFLLSFCFIVSGCTTLSTIRTNPPGARLHLNGKYMGTTPVEVELDDGFGAWARYQAEIYMDGYEPKKIHLQQDTDWVTAILVGGLVCWWCPYFNGQRHRPVYEFHLERLQNAPSNDVNLIPELPPIYNPCGTKELWEKTEKD